MSPTNKSISIIQDAFPVLSETFILDQMVGLISRGYDLSNWAVVKMDTDKIHDDVKKYSLLEKSNFFNFPDASTANDLQAWVMQLFERNPNLNINTTDAVQVHYGSMFNKLAPLFNFWDVRVTVSFHGHDASREFKVSGDNCYEYLFQRANAITTPSHYMKNELVKRGASPDKIHIHRYGINLERFTPPSREGREGVNLLTVARLVEKKGIEFALAALSLMPSREKVKYRIVGEGPLEEVFKALVAELGISHLVEFLGSKTKDQVIEEMKRADAFVLTSVTAPSGDQEGVPVALTEAHAMGLPAISTYHSGIPELVLHEKTGLLANEKDIQTTAANLEALCSNTQLRLEYGRNARLRAEEEFNIQVLNDRLAEIICPSS